MDVFTLIEEKWTTLCEKTAPARAGMKQFGEKSGKVIRSIWDTLFRLRAVFLTIPVAVAAIWLAITNMSKLPESVGIWLLSNGEFYMLVPREVAVFAPLAVTALCVLLILGAKKTIYPWLISIFTLTIPLLIYFTNLYPA